MVDRGRWDRGFSPQCVILAVTVSLVGAAPRTGEAEVRRADGEVVSFPVLEERVPPVYPPLATRMAEPGVVVVDAIVRKDGSVDDASVRHADPRAMGFEQSAKKAVRKWRYRPAMVDGVSVDVRFDIVVDFAIQKQGSVQTRNAWPQFWLECRREAFVAKEKGDLQEAEERFRHAVFDARGLGEADGRLALAHRDLAGFLAAAGKAEEARSEYMRALEVYGQALGPDHADLAPVRLELAAVLQILGRRYLDQGRTADAGPFLQETLRIREEQLGPDHPETRASREDLRRVAGAPAGS